MKRRMHVLERCKARSYRHGMSEPQRVPGSHPPPGASPQGTMTDTLTGAATGAPRGAIRSGEACIVDVCIVGAGPVGGPLACRLAMAGVSTAIVDRAPLTP